MDDSSSPTLVPVLVPSYLSQGEQSYSRFGAPPSFQAQNPNPPYLPSQTPSQTPSEPPQGSYAPSYPVIVPSTESSQPIGTSILPAPTLASVANKRRKRNSPRPVERDHQATNEPFVQTWSVSNPPSSSGISRSRSRNLDEDDLLTLVRSFVAQMERNLSGSLLYAAVQVDLQRMRQVDHKAARKTIKKLEDEWRAIFASRSTGTSEESETPMAVAMKAYIDIKNRQRDEELTRDNIMRRVRDKIKVGGGGGSNATATAPDGPAEANDELQLTTTSLAPSDSFSAVAASCRRQRQEENNAWFKEQYEIDREERRQQSKRLEELLMSSNQLLMRLVQRLEQESSTGST